MIPAADLQTVDALWKAASNNRFGYSVQKEMWVQVRSLFVCVGGKEQGGPGGGGNIVWPEAGWLAGCALWPYLAASPSTLCCAALRSFCSTNHFEAQNCNPCTCTTLTLRLSNPSLRNHTKTQAGRRWPKFFKAIDWVQGENNVYRKWPAEFNYR